ncbi:hypothetical protein [Burkholderia anthina]|nr:hypothetical protein [Burkholderia anthina]
MNVMEGEKACGAAEMVERPSMKGAADSLQWLCLYPSKNDSKVIT